jgi:hypothetical protein
VYGPKLEDMIFAFQKDYGIVSSRSDAGAGNYGPKTTAKMEEVYTKYLSLRAEEQALIEKSKAELLSARDTWKVEQDKAEKYISSFGSPKL